MADDGNSFADGIFTDPSRKAYAKSRVKNMKVTFDTATEFDQETIRNMDSYKILAKQNTLYSIASAAHTLAKDIENKTGLTNVEVSFEPGKAKDEIDVRYKFGKRQLDLSFPYQYHRHMLALQGRLSQRADEDDKTIYKFLAGTVMGRYHYSTDIGRGHAILVEKQWHGLWDAIDAVFKVKYSNRWLDLNVKESCWTKQWKFIYDLNKDSVLFKHYLEVRPPNYLYTKFSHKARNNLVDSDKCSPALLRSMAYPDGLLSFKMGHKNTYDLPWLNVSMKSSAELARNKTDAAFLKLRSGVQNYYNIMQRDWVLWHNSLSMEKIAPLTEGGIRLNDAPMIRGMKGIYDFPGAKTYRNPMVEAGREHVGDRVPNHFVAQYETKFYFPNLSPFKHITLDWIHFLPYIYGTVGYAKPMGEQFAGNGLAENLRASTGFGLSLISDPFAVEFYYSLGSIQPKCDRPREFGFYLGFD